MMSNHCCDQRAQLSVSSCPTTTAEAHLLRSASSPGKLGITSHSLPSRELLLPPAIPKSITGTQSSVTATL